MLMVIYFTFALLLGFAGYVYLTHVELEELSKLEIALTALDKEMKNTFALSGRAEFSGLLFPGQQKQKQ
jgi:hypothetical protein